MCYVRVSCHRVDQHRPRPPHRRHRAGDARRHRARRGRAHPRAVRHGPLPHGPRQRRTPRQAHAPAHRPARLPVHRRRPRQGAAGRGGRGDGPQLQPRPRRHRGQRRRAPPPARAVDDRRRAPGHQHRRRAVHAQSHGPLPTRGGRLRRRAHPAPDAPLRRDLPGPVRGPVHGHLDLRARRVDVGRLLLRHDRPQDGLAHRRLGRGRSRAGHRRRAGHRAPTAASAGRWAWPSSSTTTCWASGATRPPPARRRPTSPRARRRCRSSTPWPRPPAPTASACGPSSPSPEPSPRADEVAEVLGILERVGRAGLHARPRPAPTATRRLAEIASTADWLDRGLARSPRPRSCAMPPSAPSDASAAVRIRPPSGLSPFVRARAGCGPRGPCARAARRSLPR